MGGAAKGIALIGIAAGAKLKRNPAACSGDGFCSDRGAPELGPYGAVFSENEPAKNDCFIAVALLFSNLKAPVAAKAFVELAHGR